MTTVTVVVPVYNGAEYLFETLDSVFSQTFQDLECVVVDDGSTDNTQAVLASSRDDRLRVITHEQNRGLSAARNTGIIAAAGEYIVFLDDDDLLHPEAVERLVTAIEDTAPSCAGVFTGHRRLVSGDLAGERGVPAGRTTRTELEASNVVGGPSCTLFRTDVCLEVDGFDESLVCREDIDFYLRVTDQYWLLGIDRQLYDRRYHPEQMTKNHEVMIKGQTAFLKKQGEGLTPDHVARRRFSIVKGYVGLHNGSKARGELRSLIRDYPGHLKFYVAYLSLLFGVRGFTTAQLVKRFVLSGPATDL